MAAPMSTFDVTPLAGSERFGAAICPHENDTVGFIAAAVAAPLALNNALAAADGLLLIRGMHAISAAPALLAQFSYAFGETVENYHQTLTGSHRVHPQVPEILRVSNKLPVNQQPPARPQPHLNDAGKLPTQFPHRRGWHSDQSYRRPPPDISLFYAVTPAPVDQAQTLYANGVAAYAGLSADLRAQIHNLFGLHVMPKSGRAEANIRNGETPLALLEHQMPQRQPVVRIHPVSGKPALFLCEAGQMDWLEGPFEGMERGVDGAGAKLLYELMTHYTSPAYTYTHSWQAGDLIIYDNRCTIHAATWFDADQHQREMWRTTVAGNPGPEYAGELGGISHL